MTVYIEYAFLENFILDFLLLRLSLYAAKEKPRLFKTLYSACLGALFAVVYPLLHLPSVLRTLLKFSSGACMCLLCFQRLKTKNDWGRYAFTLCLFFVLSFCFAGALTFFNASGFYVLLGFGFLCLLAIVFFEKLYEKRAEKRLLYDCTIAYGKRRASLFGFYDSGNLARYNNIPVCFLSPDLFFDVCGEEILQKDMGQVCDELRISTLGGEKTVPLYLGEVYIEKRKIQVYFAPNTNMLNRAYKLLLNSRIFEEKE